MSAKIMKYAEKFHKHCMDKRGYNWYKGKFLLWEAAKKEDRIWKILWFMIFGVWFPYVNWKGAAYKYRSILGIKFATKKISR